MAQGYAAMVARLHELLQGSAGASRPLDVDEREKVVWGMEPEGTPDSYLLWPTGDSDTVQAGASDVISGPVLMRSATFRLTLAAFCGGGEGGPSDEPAVALALMERWQRIVMLLGDPNNRDYATSGLVQCRAFQAGEPSKPDPEQRRMELTGTFAVQYDTATAPM